MQTLELRIKKDKDTETTIELRGVINTDNAYILDAELQPLASSGEDIVIDCEYLQYMSSAGLRSLLVARKRVGEDKIRLSNVNDMLYELLEVTGFDSLFNVERI